VFAPAATPNEDGLRIVAVRHLKDALTWAPTRRGRGPDRPPT
jgi:hypothetical protein